MNIFLARKHFKKKLAKAHRLGAEGRFQESEAIYREYLRHCPDDAQVQFNTGVLVQRRATTPAEYFEAAEFYERAVCSPILDTEVKANAMNNLGLLMVKVNHVEKGMGCFHRAVLMNPSCVAAHNNLGDALRHLGNYEQAMQSYDLALELNPDSAEAAFARGMIAIMLGDYIGGWKDYERRFDVPTFPTKRWECAAPLWNREDLSGKTILLTTEQGFGDNFQFIRYAREIKRKWPTCTVIYYGSTILQKLMLCVDGVDASFDSAEADGTLAVPYDYHCPLMSLPHRFGTTPDTVPSGRYIAVPVERISIASDKRKIGIVWAGSPRHGKDAWRSIEPESFQPIIDAHPDCQFYSLQVGPRQHEVARLRGVVDMAGEIGKIGDWTATAEVLQQLDLLISVDTACVHLAGAMCVPVWMLCPSSPDFRWGLSGETTSWYPSMRIFRQPKEGDWQSVLNRINDAL